MNFKNRTSATNKRDHRTSELILGRDPARTGGLFVGKLIHGEPTVGLLFSTFATFYVTAFWAS